MKTEQLKYFFMVAESKSFNKASIIAFVSKQALMKQLDSLEEELGFALINRSVHGVELTYAGQAFYNNARKIYNELMKCCSDCQSIAASRNIVRIACAPVPILELADVMDAFIASHPDIKLEIVYHDTTEEAPLSGMLDNLYDVCALNPFQEYLITGFSHTPLGKRHLYCLVSSSHPLAQKDIVLPEDIHDTTVGMRLPKRKAAIVHALEELNQNVSIVEFWGNETEFIYNHCFGGNVYLSYAPFARDLRPLRVIPVGGDYDENVDLFYKDDPKGSVKEFIRFTLDYYKENNITYLN